MKHCFFAHQKSWDDDQVDDSVSMLSCLLTPLYPDGITVTAGRDDYQARARGMGGWRSWVTSVATGRRIGGGARFDVLILPPGTVGRATAEMVGEALTVGKPVVQWDGKKDFERGKSFLKVVAVNGRHWRGNEVVLQERLEPR